MHDRRLFLLSPPVCDVIRNVAPSWKTSALYAPIFYPGFSEKFLAQPLVNSNFTTTKFHAPTDRRLPAGSQDVRYLAQCLTRIRELHDLVLVVLAAMKFVLARNTRNSASVAVFAPQTKTLGIWNTPVRNIHKPRLYALGTIHEWEDLYARVNIGTYWIRRTDRQTNERPAAIRGTKRPPSSSYRHRRLAPARTWPTVEVGNSAHWFEQCF